MSKEVAITESAPNPLSIFGPKEGAMPSYVMDDNFKGAGNENVGAEDFAIPTIDVLQGLSPEIETVAGARPGLLFNSATQELMTECYVVNVHYIRDYAVFRKRNRGGGFHGSFATQAEADASLANLPGSAEEYDVIETAKHTVMLVDPETGLPKGAALMRFKSTGLQTSRTWNTQLQLVNKEAPRFASVWKVTTIKRTKDQNTWYLPNLECVGVAPEPLFHAAAELFTSVKSA